MHHSSPQIRCVAAASHSPGVPECMPTSNTGLSGTFSQPSISMRNSPFGEYYLIATPVRGAPGARDGCEGAAPYASQDVPICPVHRSRGRGCIPGRWTPADGDERFIRDWRWLQPDGSFTARHPDESANRSVRYPVGSLLPDTGAAVFAGRWPRPRPVSRSPPLPPRDRPGSRSGPRPHRRVTFRAVRAPDDATQPTRWPPHRQP